LQNDLPIVSAFVKVINMSPKVLILTRFLLPALSPVFLKFETNHGKKSRLSSIFVTQEKK